MNEGLSKTEIDPETRLMLIELAEGFAEGVRNGTFRFSEEGGRRLAGIIRGIVNPEMEGVDPESVYTLQAADFYGCNAEMPALRLSGAALMYAGVTLPIMLGNTPSVQMIWKKTE